MLPKARDVGNERANTMPSGLETGGLSVTQWCPRDMVHKVDDICLKCWEVRPLKRPMIDGSYNEPATSQGSDVDMPKVILSKLCSTLPIAERS